MYTTLHRVTIKRVKTMKVTQAKAKYLYDNKCPIGIRTLDGHLLEWQSHKHDLSFEELLTLYSNDSIIKFECRGIPSNFSR